MCWTNRRVSVSWFEGQVWELVQGDGSKCTWSRSWSDRLVTRLWPWRPQQGQDILLRGARSGSMQEGCSSLRLWRTWETSFIHWFQGPRAWESRRECKKGHREEGPNHHRNGTKNLWCLIQPPGTWRYWVCIKVEMIVTDLYGFEI